MFIDTTLTPSDLSSWCASGKWNWNVAPCGSLSRMYQFPIGLQKAECLFLLLSFALCVAFISLFDRVCPFFPFSTLNCTRRDILFWNSKARCALISLVYCFNGINSILSLYWNTVRACLLCATKKNRPKLDLYIIYRLFPSTYSVTQSFTSTEGGNSLRLQCRVLFGNILHLGTSCDFLLLFLHLSIYTFFSDIISSFYEAWTWVYYKHRASFSLTHNLLSRHPCRSTLYNSIGLVCVVVCVSLRHFAVWPMK